MEYFESLYDESAERYDSILVNQRFKRPADDLIRFINPLPGCCMIDIGTGTGAALFPAMQYVVNLGKVIGLDPSADMLRVAQTKGAQILIEGKIPGVCFMENTFDAACANFVLSHMENYQQGLNEIFRILKPGAVFGTTTWAEGQKYYNTIWASICKEYIHTDVLSEMTRVQIPWESWFENQENIGFSLREAGFTNIEIQKKDYRLDMSLTDYLECRYMLLIGKFIQRILSPKKLIEFREKMYQTFFAICGDNITYVGSVNIIKALKPIKSL